MQIPSALTKKLLKKSLFILPLLGLLSACGSDNDDIKPDPNTKVLHIDFNDSIAGWKTGFADYPAGEETFYELGSSHSNLPAALNTQRKGYKVTGNNHSDDLFMFVTKKVDGLEPNTRYDLRFKVTFGTNAQNNCVGIGGSPGNSVWIKVGATKDEPKAVDDGTGFLLLNWDKGNQAAGGSDAIIAGDFANSQECSTTDVVTTYLKKSVMTEKGAYSTITDDQGSLWLLMGTDSGFEGTTTIYFMDLEVVATKK
ncbi:hypothetical protein [Cellvibrio sp. OA-2007]|uniref:hypothetical protein n=1 Tax=Cellvibrio sp. OA-2007 TaxID=529823 RepID=UPI000781F4BD|nr:hypothetical protein [Cellvibrio sp. OA-2007]